jgi:hypothetical protein
LLQNRLQSGNETALSSFSIKFVFLMNFSKLSLLEMKSCSNVIFVRIRLV